MTEDYRSGERNLNENYAGAHATPDEAAAISSETRHEIIHDKACYPESISTEGASRRYIPGFFRRFCRR